MLVGMRDSLKSCTKKGWERKTVLEAQMTDVWDAEYNCREKKAGMQDQDQPHPPLPRSDSEPHGKNKMQL